MSDDQPIDLVASVADLDPVVATLRDVLHRSGALRVVAVVDREEPAIVDVGRLLPVVVQVGERLMHLPHAMELDGEPVRSADDVQRLMTAERIGRRLAALVVREGDLRTVGVTPTELRG